MKVDIGEKIYLIAAIDSIINENNSNIIDLGNYQLEYVIAEERRLVPMLEGGGIPSIEFMVKVRNKKTKKLGWAEAYFKALRNYEYNSLFELTIDEKINFIFRKEARMSRKKYSTCALVIPSDFWNEIQRVVDFDFQKAIMPRNLSAEGKQEVINYCEFLINEVKQRKEGNMRL